MNHYEFTGETRPLGAGRTLKRIRATRDLPQHGVRVGDIGGWIESEKNLFGDAWVSGNALVFDSAWVFDSARVFGNAWVFDSARVFGNARVFDSARVSGNALVFDSARVSGNARVSDSARVFDNARVERADHVLTVSPIGSENVTATLFRTAYGHTLAVGCWDTGTLETLPAEVERRATDWEGSDLDHEVWRAQYDALYALGAATVKRWEA